MKLLLLASYVCLSLAYSNIPTQYHIQTDDGPNRYFRYQTYNGQYRNEKRFEDGTVVGTYGWVDANNYLRLYKYIADENGYRIVSFKKEKVSPPITSFHSQPKVIVHQSPQIFTRNNIHRTNSMEEDEEGTQINNKQLEFINSKIHPKLQPDYYTSQRRQTNSEEDISAEETIVSQRRRKPEFINSKMHPQLRPQYSTAVNQPRVSQRRQNPPEFVNSKMHPKLRPLYNRSKKRQTFHKSRGNSGKSGNAFQSRRNSGVSQISQNSGATQRSKKAPEFINSKIHPKLLPNSGNDNQNVEKEEQFGAKTSTSQQTTISNTKSQNSQQKNVKSMGVVPEEFRMDKPGGRMTIDFDLGNQYRKEKIYPDGRVVGEHGYVDPLGILRKTYYTSGPAGLKQKKISYWVGTRSATS